VILALCRVISSFRRQIGRVAQAGIHNPPGGAMTDITPEILARFRWVDGHADVWRLFSDADFFPTLVRALADPFRDLDIGKVVGIEARGFILGGAVAVELNSGFAAIRKRAVSSQARSSRASRLRTIETTNCNCSYNASRLYRATAS
jgi:hypothetical protein